MIFEFTPDVLVEMFRTDNVIRCIVDDGIPRDGILREVLVNQNGNVELDISTAAGGDSDRKSITITDLRGTG